MRVDELVSKGAESKEEWVNYKERESKEELVSESG